MNEFKFLNNVNVKVLETFSEVRDLILILETPLKGRVSTKNYVYS